LVINPLFQNKRLNNETSLTLEIFPNPNMEKHQRLSLHYSQTLKAVCIHQWLYTFE